MINSGYPFYGQNIGVLVFAGKSPRVPGDPGHSYTFDFPVCYEIIDGKFSDLISGSDEIRSKLVKAVNNLNDKGVKAVIGDCGLMALYQREMAACCSIPVLTSSLVLIPLIWSIIGREGAIGVITGHAGILSGKHLEAAGVTEDIALEIQGMEEQCHFKKIVIDGGSNLDVDLMGREVLSAVGMLLERNGSIKAILLECSNLATYSKIVHDRFNVPVFDIVACSLLMEYSVNPRDYRSISSYSWFE